jgi:uncharacterized protein (TIGR02246 family)
MAIDKITQASHDIRDVIDQINRTWLKGDPADLERFFHPDVVIQPPGPGPRVHGRDPCIASYEAFGREARVLRFEPETAEIDVFGDTAVATYRYRIVYEMNARNYDDNGGELLVFLRGMEGWRVAWRTMLA